MPGYSADLAFEMGASERIFAFGVDTKTGDFVIFGAYNIGRVLFDPSKESVSKCIILIFGLKFKFTHLSPDVKLYETKLILIDNLKDLCRNSG